MKIEFQSQSDEFFSIEEFKKDTDVIGYQILDTRFTGISSHPFGPCNDESCTHGQCVEFRQKIADVLDEDAVQEVPQPPAQTPRAAPIVNNSGSGSWFSGTIWG